MQNNIINDYIADMAKYATHTESVKIRAAYNSIPVQLAKENQKFQYKLAQRGGTATIFGSAIDWLSFAGVEVKTGTRTKSRSLALYMQKYNPAYSIRISSKNFGFENNIKSVPLYAVFCI